MMKNNLIKDTNSIGVALLEKLEKICAYCVPIRESRDAKEKAKVKLIEEILENHQMDPFLRGAIITDINRIIKEYKRKTDILNLAMDYFSPNAKPEDVEEDWLCDYFEKAGKISEDGMRTIWARLLAEEVNSPKTISRKMLQVLYSMDRSDANNFMNIAQFFFIDEYEKSYHPLIYIKNNKDLYKNYGITTEILSELQFLGLIECNYDKDFVFKKKKILKYQSEIIELSKDEINAGNVRLTKIGQVLSSIAEINHEKEILKWTKEKWKRRNIEFKISGN